MYLSVTNVSDEVFYIQIYCYRKRIIKDNKLQNRVNFKIMATA